MHAFVHTLHLALYHFCNIRGRVLVLQVDQYLHQLPIKALPGIGRVLEDKLKQRSVSTCGQLRMIPKVIFCILKDNVFTFQEDLFVEMVVSHFLFNTRLLNQFPRGK